MKRMIVSLTLVLLIACSTQSPPEQQLSLPSVEIDTSITPPVRSLPGFTGNTSRPVASVTGPDGTQAEFVENELWMATDNQAELTAFLDRWQGEILQSFEPEDFNLPNLTPQYLVRVNTSAADTTQLAADLRELDETATGNHSVSSLAAQQLLAAGAREATNGLNVGMNWVASGEQIRNRSSREAPAGSSLGGVTYDPNAFTWPSHSVDSNQDIGVAEAWRALELAGQSGNRVKIAILDMGFHVDADVPSGFIAISNVPLVNPVETENLLSCGGGSECPWHGTNVLSAAMAVPDNDYGSAGSAGVVGDAVMVFTSYDFFTTITALGAARAAGAKIANMSYGAPVPDYLAWSVLPFEGVTAALRATGMLLFAAAGNDGKNVDAERCFIVCWEKTWYTPCENAGVICVGGINANATSRANGSNYGKKQVDIFAPYTLWLGPDPDSPDNRVQNKSGTSFSAPFTAGIAALIWAADPGLSADNVETILLNTAHSSSDDEVGRYVNAYDAVLEALGNVAPVIDVFAIDDGEAFTVPLNLTQNWSASVTDLEDGQNCCTLTWQSSTDGILGTGAAIQPAFTSTGSRVISVSAEDSDGAVGRVSFTVTVVNTAPTVTLTKPTAETEIFEGTPASLSATSFDLNEPDAKLECSALVWTSSVVSDAFPVTGCDVEVTFDSTGERTLTVTGSDPQGQSASDSVVITVLEAPVNLPPLVRITSPESDASISPNAPIDLAGTAIDAEDDTPFTFEWTAALNGADAVTIGSTPGLTWTPSDTFDFSGEGSYELRLQFNVTDSQDNTGSDFVVFEFIIIN